MKLGVAKLGAVSRGVVWRSVEWRGVTNESLCLCLFAFVSVPAPNTRCFAFLCVGREFCVSARVFVSLRVLARPV